MQTDHFPAVEVLGIGAVAFCLVLALIIHYRSMKNRLENQLIEIRPLTEKMIRVEQEFLFIVQFLRELPRVIGDLNTPKQRIIPEALMNILVRVFQPEQVVVLVRRRATILHPDRGRQLVVAAVHVPSPSIGTGMKIQIGEGELGCLAESRDVLERSDFEHPDGSPLFPSESPLGGIRVDLGARLAIGDEVLGVLAISQPNQEHTHGKEVLRLIAQLGAFALSHATERDFIQSVADIDPLTEIYNRGVLDYRLGELTYAAEKRNDKLAVFFFGIDHFKRYNDRNGHIAADELLKMLVRVSKDQIHQNDIFCRYGSDLFCLLLPGRSPSEAFITAEKIRTAIESYDFRHGEGQPQGRLTISGGIAAYPESGSSDIELLRAVDKAYYQAKNSGRNRVVVALPKVVIN